MSEDQPDAAEALQVAQRALAKCVEIERDLDELQESGEAMDARLDALEAKTEGLLGDLDE